MVAVRIVLGVLIAMAVIVAVIPAVVLIDLASGGTGLGLCPDGLGRCDTSAFAAAELAIALGLAMALLGGGIALCLRALRRDAARRTLRV